MKNNSLIGAGCVYTRTLNTQNPERGYFNIFQSVKAIKYGV